MKINVDKNNGKYLQPQGPLALVLLAVLVSVFSLPLIASASGEDAVFTIGSTTYQAGGIDHAMDASPFIKDGRTLVPVRYLASALGVVDSNILWDPVKRQVTLIKGDTTIVFTIGSMEYLVNAKKTQMDIAPLIQGGRTYLPARYLAEALGYDVGWDAVNRAVLVTSSPTMTPKTYTISISGYSFVPDSLSIHVGDTVIWTNQDSVGHTVTGGELDSLLLKKGESYTFTFTKAGTYDYICTPHPFMTGSVTVE